MKVTNAKGTAPFIGDTTVSYISLDKKDTTVLHLDAFPFPVFNQSSIYKARISCFEIYTNKDKGANKWKLDTVPVTEGKITINNDLSDSYSTTIEMSSGDTSYVFRAGNPNTLTDLLNPLFDYTKVFKIQIETGIHTIEWKPLPVDKGEYYRAYVLGSKSADGQSFVTNGPEVVDFILRDPPGSGSSAKLEVGSSISTKESFSLGGALSRNSQYHLKGGTEFIAGIGFETTTKMTQTNTLGWKVEAKLSESGEFSQSTKIVEAKQTNSNAELVGAASDLFIGKSRNMEFGIANGINIVAEDVYTLDGVDEAATIVKIGNVNYSVARRKTLMIVPGGYETGFVYDRNHIENYLIPNLEMLRNHFFVSQPTLYISHLADNDENYGKNNDDHVWGPRASSITPYSTELEDYDGPSYKFNKKDDNIDSIRVFNQQIRLWHEALKKDEKEKALAIKSGKPERNISINAGPTLSFTSESTKTSSETTSIELNLEFAWLTKINADVAGVGFEMEQGITLNITSSFAMEVGWENTTSISYDINDPNTGDYFSIDVFQSKDGNGPMFYTRAGQTSCPYEGGFVSQYYEPGTPLSLPTLKREVPTILVNGAKSAKLTNIPADQAAVFNLTLGNESESGDDYGYVVSILESSNPYGAILKMDGVPVFRQVTVPAGSSINKVLTIEKGSGDVYQYNDIGILINSACGNDADIADTAYVSAYFIPNCTNIQMINPNDKWVVNTSNNDTLNVVISDYNINFSGLNNIKFWYKSSSEASWIGLDTWYKDTTGMYDKTAKPISTSDIFTLYRWDLKQIKDGYFDIKSTSSCTYASGESTILSGMIDRVNPHPFGNPQPADGILSPNDEIQITFNETIDAGLVNSSNFDIRGVLNKSKLAHDASLNFNGVSDYLTIENGLSLKNSFSVEFWIKRANTGAPETVFSQGVNASQSVSIGFNTNKIVFNIAGQTNTSSKSITDQNWHHIVCAYNKNTGDTQIFIDGNLDNSLKLMVDYTQEGRIYVGKSSFDNKTFAGNMHELRIWNKAVSLSEVIERMNISLSGNEFNLVGCWKMNEVRGNTTADIARGRNATINGATWSILPSGSSNQFDGNDDYLDYPAANVAVSNEMDFTVEFWLNGGAQTDTVCLFSNGNGFKKDLNTTDWSILASPDGKIHVKNNGFMFTANVNVLDNTWKHFALVVNRIGNTYVYLNGNLAGTETSENWNGFGGSKLWIGCRGWINGTVENRANYFKGLIDEVRFWTLARRQEQIDRDMINRLKGDESGLRIYLPFEKFVNEMGVQTLKPTLTNIVDNSTARVYNGSAFSANVPAIKMERPVSSIPFTYSVNNDKIIVTPNIDAALIENVTLDITCKDIKDLNGNTMQSPKTWIAYMDKNQVKWQDKQLSFDKPLNESLTFKTNIINSGGALKTFTINNLPNWLTVDKSNGVISPNSYQSITFTVNQSLNIGNYEQTVFLLTDFGYNEPLLINVNVEGISPAWNIVPEKFQYSQSIIGQVIIDGLISNNPNDKVAAFVRDSCVGVANLKYIESYDKYLVFLDIYSNKVSGDTVKLKIWNASKGVTHTEVLPEIKFATNEILGTITKPIDIKAVNTYIQEIQLSQGWKWVSFNLSSLKLADVNRFLSGMQANDGDMVKGQTVYDQYNAKTGWLGTLSDGGGFKIEQMYMLKSTFANKLTYTGAKVKTTDYPITIKTGWNWISFVPNANISVKSALGNFNPQSGDIIKSQYGFAMYDEKMGWLGSLEYMKPGMGYMLKTSNTATSTLIYPEAGMKKSNEVSKNGSPEMVVSDWKLIPENYPFNASLIAESDLAQRSDFNRNYIVGAFLGNDCRGIAEPVYNQELKKWIYFVPVYGNISNEKIGFKVINTSDNKIFDMNETISFNPNDVVGSISKPFTLTAKSPTSSIENISETEHFLTASPNPFSTHISIKYQIPEKQKITISIYNQLGILISKILNSETLKGTYTIELDEKITNKLNMGVYFIKLEGTHFAKIVKVVKIN